MSAIPKFDKGSAIVLEVEFKQYAPFGTTAYFNPTDPKISVIDNTGVFKITDAALTSSATGKYYYVCQTTTGWESGHYQVKVAATSGSYTDITQNAGFALA